MKFWIVLLFVGTGLLVNAQEAEHKNVKNEVKDESILKIGKIEDNEKALKKAEKAQKRAEKELKQKQRAQDDFERASKKLDQNQEKYDRFKNKGDLSPNDEAKWLKRLNQYKKNMEKAKKKLMKS